CWPALIFNSTHDHRIRPTLCSLAQTSLGPAVCEEPMNSAIDKEIIAGARVLYDAGPNVFPIPFASKDPYGSTTILTTSRIHHSYIEELFTGSNIAVMTGRLSQNLCVLDCDDDDTFAFVGENLRKRKIRAWIRMGMRGAQFWLRCAEGEVQNANL